VSSSPANDPCSAPLAVAANDSMAKIGRNDPCPCGSGKKYKKCCLGKVQHAPARALANATMPPSPPPATGALCDEPPVSAYALARMFEKSDEYKRMRRRHPERAARYCTPGELAKLSTAELTARLSELGVDASREAFLGYAEGQSSAWAIGEQWRARIEQPLSRYQEDLVGLGACELWKRHLPQRPSMEMLDDWMAQGYERLWAHDPLGACERWLEVWQQLRPRLRPEMRTVAATASVFSGGEYLYNWIQEFCLELHNAAQDDRRYAEHGRDLCQVVLAQFPDEDALFRINFRADLGDFLYLLGEDKQAERVFLDLIDDHPDDPAGYARLAEVLGHGPSRERGPIDVPRAIELLERALARPVEDPESYDLAARLRELRERSRSQDASATGSVVGHDTERATRTAES